MLNRSMRKIGLISVIGLLMAMGFLLPPVTGYGTSFSTAQEVTSGTYYEMLSSSHYYAYYKVYLSTRQSISVSIYYYSGDLDLYLYDPYQSLDDSSTSGGDTDSVSTKSKSDSGYYYIEVYRYSGSGDIDFDLSITVSDTIPGFEIIYVLFGFLIILGLLTLYKNRKSIFINNP